MARKSIITPLTPVLRGRPPVNPPNLSERTMVRITDDEKRRWADAAQAEGISLSTYLRRAARAGLGELRRAS